MKYSSALTSQYWGSCIFKDLQDEDFRSTFWVRYSEKWPEFKMGTMQYIKQELWLLELRAVNDLPATAAIITQTTALIQTQTHTYTHAHTP